MAAVLCVLALFVALMLWSARPRWYTFVSEPIRVPAWKNQQIGRTLTVSRGKPSSAFPTFAVALRIPVGWECQQSAEPDAHHLNGNMSQMVIIIRRKPLTATGFLRWWNEIVLHTDTRQNQDGYNSYAVSMRVTQGNSKGNSIGGIFARNVGPAVRTMHRVFEHPLGAAREQIVEIYRGRLNGQLIIRTESTHIDVRQHPTDVSITLDVSHNRQSPGMDRYQSTWNEIVRSIRVVQK